MKSIQHVLFVTLMLVSLVFQCSSVPKIQEKAPIDFKTVYYKKWNAGTQEGGSGIHIYLEMKDSLTTLDSVYFHGKVTKLQPHLKNSLLYIGQFDLDVQISSWPFQIKRNECIVSYLGPNKILYFKLSNIEEREPLNYPSTSTKNL